MRIIEVKNCFNLCKLCREEREMKWAIVFDNYILTLCDECLEKLREILQEGD